ncbi:MAG: type III pantothenate kinase [Muribaculaceae bacterium]
MKLNIAIDQGNTATKVSLFDGLTLVSNKKYKALNISDIEQLLSENEIGVAIYSSVQKRNEEIENLLHERLDKCLILSYKTPMPMTIDYATPHTLGNDRIAAAVGALCEMPEKNVLIIDAGTAVTLDLLNKKGHFVGGNITPGLRTRFESLHNFTDKLPLIDEDGDIPLIGYDTSTAIRAGVVNGLVSEIEGYIDCVTKEIGDLTVFMTGGDSQFLAKRIKSPIFGDENLLSKGLNRILLYNNESI